MDFTFNEDQLALRDSVNRFLANEASAERLREIWASGSGAHELYAKFAEQGVTALSVPEAYGGLGLTDIDWVLITEELGYHAISDSLSETAYVASNLLGTLPQAEALRERWLPGIAAGTVRAAIEHPVNPWVTDLQTADLVLVFRTAADTLELHALSGGAGLQAAAMRSIDGIRRPGVLTTPLQASTIVLAGAAARKFADATLDRAAIAVAGQLIGLARRMLDLSVSHAAQRQQFGRPIGSFQAIKHHLADVLTRIEFARPVLYRAAMALQRDEPDRAALISHAKLASAEAAWCAARNGIQIHGASGYTWEVDLQMFMKRTWALDAAWGDRGFHKARLREALLRDDALLGPAATLYRDRKDDPHV